MPRRGLWLSAAILVLFPALLTIPFLIANASTDTHHVFDGFLFNPIDGQSYLAKMRQGYEGSWLFTLPYTADPGEGAAINLYYLFLGHVARTFGLSLLFTFHAARILGGIALGLALYVFFRRVFPDRGSQDFAFSLALFGSGLGWLVIWFGSFTSDFWVAEAYPFLASLTNAHFPLGLALQVWLLSLATAAPGRGGKQLAFAALAAVLLSIIFPFGWIVVVVTYGGHLLWLILRHELIAGNVWTLLAIVAGGFPYAAYALWVTNSHLVLSQWNAQNITPTPGLLDLSISLLPALPLAVWGAYCTFTRGTNGSRLLAVWLLVGIILIYVPFGLQRRLISGLFIPVAGLAATAFARLELRPSFRRFAATALFALALPTNAIRAIGSVAAVAENDSRFTLSVQELEAFTWLEGTALPGSLVLASPDSGLLLPAYAPVRVVYGHPLETIDADARHAEVTAFFSGALDQAAEIDYLEEWGVDYVLYGPRERQLGSLPELPGWQLVFDQDDLIQIWAHPQN
ncbi:MAG: hypothetical protein WD751_08495 [Anaerolineales bacterium]